MGTAVRLSNVAYLLFALGLAISTIASAQVYKWTDEHGHVHYSDKPPKSKSVEEVELETANIMQSQRDEFWDFEFDGREWVLGHSEANENSSIREYILLGQSINDWTELLTSQSLNSRLSVHKYFDTLWKENPDCPSLKTSKIHESNDSILFHGRHGLCGGYQPGEFIQRIARIEEGIILLTYAQKTEMSGKNREAWTRILREATRKYRKPNVRTEQPEALSLSLQELGPLPENSTSKYLKTVSTAIRSSLEELSAQLAVTVAPKKGLPAGAYLEAHFPDPSNLETKNITSKVFRAGQADISLVSPKHRDIKCWNYEVVIHVYRGESKTKLLGTHHQIIQSRVNYSKVEDASDLLSASQTGRCP